MIGVGFHFGLVWDERLVTAMHPCEYTEIIHFKVVGFMILGHLTVMERKEKTSQTQKSKIEKSSCQVWK